MRRRSMLVMLVLIPFLAVAIRAYWPRDISRWPMYEVFRCRRCDGPAAIDPREPHRWGCPGCDFCTLSPDRRFRVAKPKDFATSRGYWDAEKAAGAQSMTPGCPWAVYFRVNI